MITTEALTDTEARRAWAGRASSVGTEGNIAVEANDATNSGDVQLVCGVLELVPSFAFEVKIPDVILMEPIIDNVSYIRLNEHIESIADVFVRIFTIAGVGNGCFHTLIILRFLR